MNCTFGADIVHVKFVFESVPPTVQSEIVFFSSPPKDFKDDLRHGYQLVGPNQYAAHVSRQVFLGSSKGDVPNLDANEIFLVTFVPLLNQNTSDLRFTVTLGSDSLIDTQRKPCTTFDCFEFPYAIALLVFGVIECFIFISVHILKKKHKKF